MSVARESVAWLLVLAAPALVQAQGLATPGTGTAESTAATPDPVAVAFNPAMTSFLERPELFLGGSLVVGDVRYRRDYRAAYQREDQFDFALPIVPASVDQSKAGQAEAVRANPVAVAPSLFLAVPLARQRVTLGLGVHSPYRRRAEPAGEWPAALSDPVGHHRHGLHHGHGLLSPPSASVRRRRRVLRGGFSRS